MAFSLCGQALSLLVFLSGPALRDVLAALFSCRDDGVPVFPGPYRLHCQVPLAETVSTALVPFQPVLGPPCVFRPVVPIIYFFLAGYPVLGVGCSCLGPPSTIIPLHRCHQRDYVCVCVGGGGGMQRRSKSLAFGWRKSMWHFSWLKLEAEFHSLLAFLPALSGKAARLFNNNTVAFYASKGGACSFSLSLSTVEMLWWCQSHGIAPFSQTFSQQVEHRGQHFESSSQCSSHGMGYVQSGIPPVWDLWFILMVDLLLPSSATGS